MEPPDPTVATGWGVALVAFAAAVFERVRNVKTQNKAQADTSLLSDAKMFQARAEVLAKLAEDNLRLYTSEHEEHSKTREFWHKKASDFQATLAACQEKLSEFQSRPDFGTVVEFVRQQAKASTEILQGIREILDVIKTKVEHDLPMLPDHNPQTKL